MLQDSYLCQRSWKISGAAARDAQMAGAALQGTACYKMRPPGAMSGDAGMDVQLRQWPPCDRTLTPLSAGDYVVAAVTSSTPGTFFGTPVLRTDHARWTAWDHEHRRTASF